MPIASREAIAEFLHRCVRIEREAIFGPDDAEKWLPKYLNEDASTMFAGYVGPRYVPGKGIVLIAINPGGGGDSYSRRTPEDERFYPLLHKFKTADRSNAQKAFEDINDRFKEMVQRWNIWRIIEPTLDAAGLSLEQVAYVNLVPYRTRGDKMPPVSARKSAFERIVEPMFEILDPKAIVALGKKAGTIQQLWQAPVYCVQRTIGDRWVHDNARSVLDEIRRDLHSA